MVSRYKTSTKLSLLYAILIIILVCGAAVIYYSFSQQSIEDLGLDTLTQTTDATMGQVDNTLTKMEQVTVDVLANNQFTEAFQLAIQGDATQEETLKTLMTRAFANKNDIRRVSVFTASGLYYSTGVCTATAEQVRTRAADIQQTYQMNHMNSRTFLSPHLDDWHPESGSMVISEIKPIKNKNSEIIGYLEVQQNVMYIDRICDLSFNKNQLAVLVFLAGDELLYSNMNQNEMPEGYAADIAARTQAYTKIQETTTQVLCTATSNYYEVRMVVALDKVALYAGMGGLRQGLIVGSLLIILFTMGYILFVTSRTMQPLNQLVRHMAGVDLSNLQQETFYEAKSYESRVLFSAFEQMRQRLNSSMEERQRLETLQTKTLFSILQSEMSPHFLYNSLSSIANMCENGNSADAASACYSLAEVLRYASDYASTEVTVLEETVYLRSYLAVMKSRYQSRLDFSILLDEDAETFELPKMTYQPIVENAIKYGLENRERIDILVNTQMVGGVLTVEVRDNGCGISPEALRRVQEKVADFKQSAMSEEITSHMKMGGLGLGGTLIRLSIFFGERFRYELVPCNADGGSTVLLWIDTA